DGIRDRNVTGVQTCALPILVSGAVLVRQAALLIFGCLPPVAWAVTGFKASHETGSTNVTAFHWPVLPNPLVPRSLVGSSLTSCTHGNSILCMTSWAMRSPGWMRYGACPWLMRMILISPVKPASIVPGALSTVSPWDAARPDRGVM